MAGLDQYYTNPEIAKLCIERFKHFIPKKWRKLVVEPSAGAGAFLQYDESDILAFDIDPKHPKVLKHDFFDWNPSPLFEDMLPRDSVAVLGNPPFGFAGSMAVKFFNHAAKYASTIAFILPKVFRKRSIQQRLDLKFQLIFSWELPKNAFIFEGKDYDVPCVFQIWIRTNTDRLYQPIENKYLEFITKDEALQSDDAFCIRRAGGKAGQLLEGLDHSIPSTYFVREMFPGVKDIIPFIDLDVAESTGPKSISKPELIEAIEDYYESTR